MEQVTLDSIRQIVEKATWDSPAAYVVLAIAVLGPALTAFLGAYFKKRAETAALADDLEQIKNQLSETTRVAEEVRTAIGFQDWHARESLRLRREKLEEIGQKLVSSHREIRAWWAIASAGGMVDHATPYVALDGLEVLVPLYFPTLRAKFGPYSIQASKVIALGFELNRQAIQATREEERQAIFLQANQVLDFEFPILHTAISDLRRAIHNEMALLVDL